jgi:hypothetical protein
VASGPSLAIRSGAHRARSRTAIRAVRKISDATVIRSALNACGSISRKAVLTME